MALLDIYTKALKEFETLTDKRATPLKNKGKEDGIKKLKVLFKSGKSLEQRFTDFDTSCDTAKVNAATALKALDQILTANAKLQEGLKKNIAEYTASEKVMGPDDKELKTGFSVLINRLEEASKFAKMTVVQKEPFLKGLAGQTQGADEELKKELKLVHLAIKTGVEQTEALMKIFIAKPSAQTMMAAFSCEQGPRTVGTAVTRWKQRVAPKHPKLADKVGFDPVHMLKKIEPLTLKKEADYWDAVFKMKQPGWEARAKKEAAETLAQMKLWRTAADKIKALI